MLVLSRKIQDRIRIGDDITITVLKVKGNSVRIGIEAPRDVRVVRAELPALETPAETEAATDHRDSEPAIVQAATEDEVPDSDLMAVSIQRVMQRRLRNQLHLQRSCAIDSIHAAH